MSVTVVNTPNLATDLAQIASFISSIEAAAPTTFDTLINACWKLKPTQDCEALILEDFTDYQELGVVDLNDLTISVTLVYCGQCGDVVVCPAQTILPNTKTTFDYLDSDGVYCAIIELTYAPGPTADDPVYTKTIRRAYRKDCCEKEYKNIARDIWGKMADLACCMRKLAKVGRNIKSMNKSYLKLSNLLYLYYNSKDACYEKEKVLCAYNKIK